MRKFIFLSAILALSLNVSGQTLRANKSPFDTLGYKKPIMFSSSRDQFKEFHDQTDVVEIGSVLFDTRTNQVVGFIDEEQEQIEVPASTPSISVDPLCTQYYWITPYHYCLNNSVNNIDPDGNFTVPIHKNITEQAMVRSGIVPKTSDFFHRSLLWGATYDADYVGFAFDWHFDGRANYSAVQTRWNSLNKDIATTIGNIGGGNKLLGGSDVTHLGKLLHNVQDFYSHSNYVELYIEYYKGANDGALPSSVPIYDEGIKNSDFSNLLKDKLRTGDFHYLDNEKIDINPFRENANEPTSHNKMNKDNADTYAGKLAKQAAIEHTTKILEEVK